MLGRLVEYIARGWVYILVWIRGVNLSEVFVLFCNSVPTVKEEMKAMLVVCAKQCILT